MPRMVITEADRGPDGRILEEDDRLFVERVWVDPDPVPPAKDDPVQEAPQDATGGPRTPGTAEPAYREPQSIRDLLPADPDQATPERPRNAWANVAAVVLVVLMGMGLARFFFGAANVDQNVPTAVPQTGLEAPGTAQERPTSVPPTLEPTPSPQARLNGAQVARWDYRFADQATPLDDGTAVFPAGTADGGAWVLVHVGTPDGPQVWVQRAALSGFELEPLGLVDMTVRPTAVPPPPDPVYVPAPAPAVAAQCYEKRMIVYDATGRIPLGEVVGTSCTSQAEADENAIQNAVDLRRSTNGVERKVSQ